MLSTGSFSGNKKLADITPALKKRALMTLIENYKNSPYGLFIILNGLIQSI